MSVESPTVNLQALRDGATRVRLAALRMIAPHGQGYLGQMLGASEIVSLLYNDVLRGGATTPTAQRDKIIISPGHYIVCAYALATRGELSDSELATYGNDGSRLEAVGWESRYGHGLGLSTWEQPLTSRDHSVFPELRKSDSPYVGTLGLFPEDWRGQKVPAVSNPSRIEFLSRANIDKLYPQDKA